MEPENTYKGSKSREEYYVDMVDRHVIHSESLVAEVSYGIKTDLDKRYSIDQDYNPSSYSTMSLRDILMDLKVETIGHEMYGTNLFHSVDYFNESSNLWINGQKCDAAACCIFTYYESNTVEATTMIRGMGKMVVKEFGSTIASEMFSLQHFRGCKGYRWSSSIRKFSTPEVRRMKANSKNDDNLPAIKILQEKKRQRERLKAQEEAKEKAQKAKSLEQPQSKKEIIEKATSSNSKDDSSQSSTEDDDSGITKEIKAKKVAQLAKKRQDSDLDSLDNNSQNISRPSNVVVQDSSSVASSITNNTNHSEGTSYSDFSLNSKATTADDMTISSRVDKYDVPPAMIAKIAEAGMKDGITAEELERQVENYQQMKISEAKTRLSNNVAAFLKVNKLPLEITVNQTEASTPTVTPNKSIADAFSSPPKPSDDVDSPPMVLPKEKIILPTPKVLTMAKSPKTSHPPEKDKDNPNTANQTPKTTQQNKDTNKNQRKSKRIRNNGSQKSPARSDNSGRTK